MQETPFIIKGKFQEDSVVIGQPIHYSLYVRHHKGQEVFFPSANTNFGAFETVKREFFSTKTTASGSLDSAVYTLRLFDLSPVQKLQIPIYLLQEPDCTLIYPVVDSVHLKRLLPHPEQIDLDSLYQSIPIQPLSPKTDLKNVLAVGISLLILAGLIYWLFGKAITKLFKRYLLWRRHREFRRTFQRYMRQVAGTPVGLLNLEKAFSAWKKYIEELTKLPFTTFTSKEMLDNLADEAMEKVLNEMDSAIYGGNFSNNTTESVQYLDALAANLYEVEQEKIQNNEV
jgi:hypothetical protein